MTNHFHDPAAVEFADDTIVLAPQSWDGLFVAGPNNTICVCVGLKDRKLGNFLVSLTPDQVQGMCAYFTEVMQLSDDELATLRDRAHAINNDPDEAA